MRRLEEQNRGLKTENQELQRKMHLNQELRDSQLKFNDEVARLSKKYQDEISELKSAHEREMQLKEEKLLLLKNQISEGIKNNSW